MRKENIIKGHITVEMALILPLLIFLIVWLVFFMIFLMDMSVVKSEVIRISDEASMIWDKKGELETGRYQLPSKASVISGVFTGGKSGGIQGKAVSRLKKRVRERLVMTSCKDIKVKVGASKVTARGSVRFRWPFPGYKPAKGGGFTFTGKAVAPVNNWEELLRKVKAVKQTGIGGKGSGKAD